MAQFAFVRGLRIGLNFIWGLIQSILPDALLHPIRSSREYFNRKSEERLKKQELNKLITDTQALFKEIQLPHSDVFGTPERIEEDQIACKTFLAIVNLLEKPQDNKILQHLYIKIASEQTSKISTDESNKALLLCVEKIKPYFQKEELYKIINNASPVIVVLSELVLLAPRLKKQGIDTRFLSAPPLSAKDKIDLANAVLLLAEKKLFTPDAQQALIHANDYMKFAEDLIKDSEKKSLPPKKPPILLSTPTDSVKAEMTGVPAAPASDDTIPDPTEHNIKPDK